jgi:hypothetical protein
MPFDAEAPRSDARANVVALRNHLANTKLDDWDTRDWCRCFAGHAAHLFAAGRGYSSHEIPAIAQRALGLSGDQARALFLGAYAPTPKHAVAILDHYLETGRIAYEVRPDIVVLYPRPNHYIAPPPMPMAQLSELLHQLVQHA